jgi:hypothetical protein
VRLSTVVHAGAGGRAGTTLAAVKTLEICAVNETIWRYSGEIALWNEGAVSTQGLAIQDCIQNKTGSGQFADVPSLCGTLPITTQIPAGTTLVTATTYEYSFDGTPLTGDIRNIARVTIANHSGHLDTPFGPEPKATWTGVVEPCDTDEGCTLTQGYWKNHTEEWTALGYPPGATFYLATKNGACIANCGGNPNDDVFEQLPASWEDVINAQPSLSQGYYQLAHQYIAAVLNEASGASVPAGIQVKLDAAEAWLGANAPSACASALCGEQRDWAAILDDYNNGVYEGGPPHCPS